MWIEAQKSPPEWAQSPGQHSDVYQGRQKVKHRAGQPLSSAQSSAQVHSTHQPTRELSPTSPTAAAGGQLLTLLVCRGDPRAGRCCPLYSEFLGLITPLLLTEAHSTRSNLQKQEAEKAGINTPTFPPGMLPPRCCLKKTNISLSRSVGKSYYKLRLTVSQITHQCRDQI